MAKTSEKVSDAAANVKPYLDRALYDAELRESVRSAYESARAIYDELLGNRGVTGIATRVATDKDIQDELRSAISELRNAADRVQGKEEERAGRNSALLLIGIVLGILFNPFTGPQTRKWLSDKAFGGGDDFTYQGRLDERRLGRSPHRRFRGGRLQPRQQRPARTLCGTRERARVESGRARDVRLAEQDRARRRRGRLRGRSRSAAASRRTSCGARHDSRYDVGSTAPS